jgi:hypothetical protein
MISQITIGVYKITCKSSYTRDKETNVKLNTHKQFYNTVTQCEQSTPLT